MAVRVPLKVTSSAPAPVAPIDAPLAVAVNDKAPAVIADVLSVILPLIASSVKPLATTFTVPRPMPETSVKNTLPLVVVTVRLFTLRFKASVADTPTPVEFTIVSSVAVISVVVSVPAKSVIGPCAFRVKVAFVISASPAAAKPKASENIVNGALIVTAEPPLLMVVTPLIEAEPKTIEPEDGSSAAISTASKPNVPAVVVPVISAVVPIESLVPFSTARRVKVVPPLIRSPPAEFKSISSEIRVTLVSPVIEVFGSTVNSLSAASVKVIFLPTISSKVVVPNVPVVTISTSPPPDTPALITPSNKLPV